MKRFGAIIDGAIHHVAADTVDGAKDKFEEKYGERPRDLWETGWPDRRNRWIVLLPRKA